LGRDVAALRGELGATVLEVRRVVEGLRPPALDELGLADSLRQATRRLAAGRLALELQLADQLQLPAAVEVAVFRIVTEAVTNAARHSGAKRCQVTVEAVGQLLRVTVSDDGRGLAQSARGGTGGGGHGLHTMRERAEELRGRLTLSSSEAGTTVTAEFPLPPRQTRPVESAQPVTA
jgi:signal transduction histidine kinase